MGSIIADVRYLSIITGSIIADVRYLSIITGSIIADVRYLSIITGSKGPKGAFWAKMGPFRTPRGPEVAQYQVKVCGEHESIQGGPIGGSRDEIWSLGDLREPQKGHFGPKRAVFACFQPFSRTGWFQMGYNSAG